jgi:AcrR family transcriptional regulator
MRQSKGSNKLTISKKGSVVRASKEQAEADSYDPVDVNSSDMNGKQKLLKAAAIEFSKHGFEGSSVLAIARRAGVKQPLLNYHFGGKDGIWRAVIEDGYRDTVEVEKAMEAQKFDADPLHRLKQLLLSFALINSRRPSVHAIMQKEVMFPSSRLDWLVDNYMSPFNQRLNSLIEECMQQGIVRKYPVEQLSVMLTGVLVSYFLASELPERMYGKNLKGVDASMSYFNNSLDVLLNGLLVRRTRKTKQEKS